MEMVEFCGVRSKEVRNRQNAVLKEVQAPKDTSTTLSCVTSGERRKAIWRISWKLRFISYDCCIKLKNRVVWDINESKKAVHPHWDQVNYVNC